MTEAKSKILTETKQIIEEAVEQLLEIGVFKPEIEIELQSYVRKCVRQD